MTRNQTSLIVDKLTSLGGKAQIWEQWLDSLYAWHHNEWSKAMEWTCGTCGYWQQADHDRCRANAIHDTIADVRELLRGGE